MEMKVIRGRNNMIRALAMFGLLVGMVVGKSTTASFQSCYLKRFVFCVIKPGNSAISCSLSCLKDCVLPSDSHHDELEDSDAAATKDNTYFCKLGCASSLCINISTKDNPAGEKVGSCVNSCSNKCVDYHPPP